MSTVALVLTVTACGGDDDSMNMLNDDGVEAFAMTEAGQVLLDAAVELGVGDADSTSIDDVVASTTLADSGLDVSFCDDVQTLTSDHETQVIELTNGDVEFLSWVVPAPSRLPDLDRITDAIDTCTDVVLASGEFEDDQLEGRTIVGEHERGVSIATVTTYGTDAAVLVVVAAGVEPDQEADDVVERFGPTLATQYRDAYLEATDDT